MSQGVGNAFGSASKSSLWRIIWPFFFIEVFSGVVQVYFVPIYPLLGSKYHVNITTLSWTLTIFGLAEVLFTPVFAKLGDMYGHRRVLKIEIAVVAIGCILIAVEPAYPILLVGRVLAGSFAAYLPLMFGHIRLKLPQAEVRRGIAYLSSGIGLGVLLGQPTIGVLVRQFHGTQIALWLPVIGFILGFCFLWIDRSPVSPPPGGRVDFTGLTLLGAGVVLMLLAISEGPTWGWASTGTITCFIIGAFSLAGWIVSQHYVRDPMANLRIMFEFRVVPVFVIGFFIYVAFIGGQVSISEFLSSLSHVVGYGFGLTALGISLALTPQSFFSFIAAFFTARFGKAIGYAPLLLVSCVLGLIGFLWLALLHGNLYVFLIGGIIGFIGLGFANGSTRTVVVENLKPNETSVGEGIYELAITMGGAVGSAVVAAILGSNIGAHGLPSVTGYTTWWFAGAIGLAVAVIMGITIVVRPTRVAGEQHDLEEARPLPA